MKVRQSTLSRICTFGALAIAVSLAADYAVTSKIPTAGALSNSDRFRDAVAFSLFDERWTVFSVPAGKALLKLVTNAEIQGDYLPESDESLDYALQMQALIEGQVVFDRTYALSSRSTYSFDDEGGLLVRSHLYSSDSTHPAHSRVIMLPLYQLDPAPQQLRVRIHSRHSALAGVQLRVFHPSDPPDYKLDTLWQRMPKEERELLAQFNLFGSSGLDADQRRQLLQNRWVAVAPVGIAGHDFRYRRLHVFEGRGALSEEDSIDRDGQRLSPTRRLSVTLPTDAKTLLWLWVPTREQVEFPQGAEATLFFDSDEGRWQHPQKLQGLRTQFTTPCAGDRVELHCNTEGVVRVFALTHSEPLQNSPLSTDATTRTGGSQRSPRWVEVTPEEQWVASYLIEWGVPLQLQVSSTDPAATIPLRLDLRRIFFEEDLATRTDTARAATWVDYELIDERDAVIGSGTLFHDQPVSRFDSLGGELAENLVSEPSRYYLTLSPACRRVRLRSSTESILVTPYTRPADGTLRREVPVARPLVDWLNRQHTEDVLHKAWFPLHPRDSGRWIDHKQRVFVSVQGRDSGSHDVSHEPRVAALGAASPVATERFLTPSRDVSSLAVGRHALHNFVPVDLQIASESSHSQVRPSLLILGLGRHSQPPSRLELWIDGKQQLDIELPRETIDVPLGDVAAGVHRFELRVPAAATSTSPSVESAPSAMLSPPAMRTQSSNEPALCRAFLSHSCADMQTWRMRDAWPLTPGTRVPVTLAGTPARLRLSVLVEETVDPTQIRVSLQPRRRPGPQRSYTFDDILLTLLPTLAQGPAAIRLSEPDTPLRELGVTVTLGDDLVGGDYVIAIEPVAGPPCWIYADLLQEVAGNEPGSPSFPPHGSIPTASPPPLRVLFEEGK